MAATFTPFDEEAKNINFKVIPEYAKDLKEQ
jgi:hypothetical protein